VSPSVWSSQIEGCSRSDALTGADPSPAGTGDGGAAAFLHGPDALFGNDTLFGNVVPLPTTDDARDPGRDDKRVNDEGGVSA
jgi:hypothetical protein